MGGRAAERPPGDFAQPGRDARGLTLSAEAELRRLLDIMAALRDPDRGCPWDRQQDFATIAPYTIEEAYEVADAIARADFTALPDELGDLLFQVVYHARMAEEAGRFDFAEVDARHRRQDGAPSSACVRRRRCARRRRAERRLGGPEARRTGRQSRNRCAWLACRRASLPWRARPS